MTPPALLAAAFTENPLVAIWALSIGSAPLAVACLLLLYFGFRQPDKLQSEEYQLRQQVIQILEKRGAPPETLSPLIAPIPDPKNPPPEIEDGSV